ncbi:fatty acid synthase-like [Adelges cooleyi]|uniref:fatty acid synthase-like n=1 Tax=Adelges cooleyi TaxID=133065 RepID=UPI00218017A1|nr:fatty acid synthase-like [Adelges cooleyi]XP_050438842.1 fatty acid synthase-like [Adelges cooleyi]XP_050438843.1 fatty acid synthase-like [Adelges cooleyi]
MSSLKDEVVISGISGKFPECNGADELKSLLFNKNNGVTDDTRGCIQKNNNISTATGKMNNTDAFDSIFFKVHSKLGVVMDPEAKLLNERAIEAIIDAGLSPNDLSGTNTAVFTGSFMSDMESETLKDFKSAFYMLGGARAMQANRISYTLNLIGPSFVMVSGTQSLMLAKQMIECGYIDTAIIGVSNLTSHFMKQQQYNTLTSLTKTAQTKSFSANADGYNRSEACIVLLLQRASKAKRSYGTILSAIAMQFGDHQGHVCQHSKDNLKSTILEAYKEAKVDPSTVNFIEAYGCGIKDEDVLELNVMEEIFCTNQRKTPLKIGSIKSNIGHTEESSFFASIIKAIITFESGYIPPNINYSTPNLNVKSIRNEMMQVVTQKTPFNDDIIGVTSFGFINEFNHVILKRNNKINQNKSTKDVLPKLIVVSGRTNENAVDTIKQILKHGSNKEYISLTQNIFSKTIQGHYHRSFAIYPSLRSEENIESWNVTLKKRPVWFVFSGMGSQWPGMGADLMRLPIFAESIRKCHDVLRLKGIDIIDIITTVNPSIFENILNSFVGIAAIQIALVNVLNALAIVPDGVIGHSVGELGCAYADGCLTAEEMLLAAYARGVASIEADLIPGMMAAIGVGYQDIKNVLPEDIDVACHNSKSSCTISGPVDSVKKFVLHLTSQGIFAKTVNVAGKAYHSRYIKPASPALLKYLKEVIKEPKDRSSKWISSSIPESEWNSNLAKQSSAEYHTNNLLSSVLFEEATRHIPKDAVVIEIAPHGLLQAILKRSLPETVTNIPLTKNVFGQSIQILLNSIGKMYTNDMNPNIQALYPSVDYPVSRGTPFLHTIPLWDHSYQWPNIYKTDYKINREAEILLSLNDNAKLIQHKINGHYFIPVSFFLLKIWEKFSELHMKKPFNDTIYFQNIKIKENIEIKPNITDSSETIDYMIQSSGFFEFSFNGTIVLTGQIEFTDKKYITPQTIYQTIENSELSISKNEVYAMFKKKGYQLGEHFKTINNVEIFKNEIRANIKWNNDWLYFLDSLLKISLLEHLNGHFIETPNSIQEIWINPTIFENCNDENIPTCYNIITKEIVCDGVKISNVKTKQLYIHNRESSALRLESNMFYLYNQCIKQDINDCIKDCIEFITEICKFDKSNTHHKVTVSDPYQYDDPFVKLCTNALKHILNTTRNINNVFVDREDFPKLSNNEELGSYITVSSIDYLQDSIKVLANRANSYIIITSKKRICDVKGWKMITEQKFDKNYVTLIKKVKHLSDDSIFIKTNSSQLDSSIWKHMEKCKSDKGKIYLISNSVPPEGINEYASKMFKIFRTQKLRFVFIWDSGAPELHTNKTFYEEQLCKDFIINIYKNGGWGSYKTSFIEIIRTDDRCSHQLFPISQIPIENIDGLTIKYLGINHKNVVIDNTEDDIGPLEYSGTTENGKAVMGIFSYNKTENILTKYNSLSWPVPPTWSLQDAVTVPLPYAMAYYVFNVLSELDKSKSILITSGIHPVGRAAISICLSERCNVYIIVENKQQVEYLSNVFPLLRSSNIIINENNNFDINIKMVTKSIGIDQILNFLEGDGLQASIRSIADHGKLFHFSKSDMLKQENMGTRIFLKDLSFYSITSYMLMTACNENKRIVQEAFAKGLNQGVIIPINDVVKLPLSSEKLFDSLKNSSTYPKKLISPLNDDDLKSGFINCATRGLYQCQADQVYVVIGNKNEWLDVAEWLVNRGARKITIMINKYLLAPSECRRFNQLLSKHVSIHIESNISIKSKEDALNWFNRLTSSNQLGGIFLINQSDTEKINQFGYAFERLIKKPKSAIFICICCKSEHVCSALKSKRLHALNIQLSAAAKKQLSITSLLTTLNSLLVKAQDMSSDTFIFNKENTDQLEGDLNNSNSLSEMPDSVDELLEFFNKLNNEADFIEIQTKSPRYSHVKGVVPVFMIPGFKSKNIEVLYAKLFYPTFEARIPKQISSINDVAQSLVTKLKEICNHSMVSLIGESWGGIIALKMAQILEAQGTLVSVCLLEGDPDTVYGWANEILSNPLNKDILENKYYSHSVETHATSPSNINDYESYFLNERSYKNVKKDRIINGLSTTLSLLKALVDSEPLPYKLQASVQIFKFNRSYDYASSIIYDFCDSTPIIKVVAESNSTGPLNNKVFFKDINDKMGFVPIIDEKLPVLERYNKISLKNYEI